MSLLYVSCDWHDLGDWYDLGD
jgi:hypothetical protein